MAPVSKHAAETSATVVIDVSNLATVAPTVVFVLSHARCDAVTLVVFASVPSRVLRAQRKDVHRLAHTVNVQCLVQHLAIGFHVLYVAKAC